MLESFSGKKIITFLAHPDDEVLGCGGTLARAVEEGAEVHCVIPVKRIVDSCQKALTILGIRNIHWGNFNDNTMDIYPIMDVAKFLENYLHKFKPDILITHHYTCCNQDHRVCYEAASIATRPIKRKIQLISCEILSSTGYLRPCNFEPNLYMELRPEHLEKKVNAMSCYETENRADRNWSSITSLASLRGGESGNQLAEGFMVVRSYA